MGLFNNNDENEKSRIDAENLAFAAGFIGGRVAGDAIFGSFRQAMKKEDDKLNEQLEIARQQFMEDLKNM